MVNDKKDSLFFPTIPSKIKKCLENNQYIAQGSYLVGIICLHPRRLCLCFRDESKGNEQIFVIFFVMWVYCLAKGRSN